MNEEMQEELNIYILNETIVDYKCKWKQHLLSMNDTPIPNLVYNYRVFFSTWPVSAGPTL